MEPSVMPRAYSGPFHSFFHLWVVNNQSAAPYDRLPDGVVSLGVMAFHSGS